MKANTGSAVFVDGLQPPFARSGTACRAPTEEKNGENKNDVVERAKNGEVVVRFYVGTGRNACAT